MYSDDSSDSEQRDHRPKQSHEPRVLRLNKRWGLKDDALSTAGRNLLRDSATRAVTLEACDAVASGFRSITGGLYRLPHNQQE